MQQEAVEKYLPNTKFTYDVMFLSDFLYILKQDERAGEMVDNKTSEIQNDIYQEFMSIKKIEIASTLDY